jgi:thioredoxin reductase
MRDEEPWECIVVGGGAAGLSAALVLGRARRRTLLVDAGRQSNRSAEGIGGLLGHDGLPPSELYAAGRRELAGYPSVEVRAGEVARGERRADGFALELAGGRVEHAERVLLATGMDYRFPRLDGIGERWGRSVFHCPFCHGWEVRDEPLGVLDRGAAGAERALLLRLWSDDVTLFAGGPAGLEPQDAERLEAAGVVVEERAVTGLRGPAPSLTAVALAGGDERPCGGLLVPVVLHQRSSLAEQLGAAAADPTPVVADGVAVDAVLATGVPGLFAAGDLSAHMPNVANAVAAGSTAAAAVVRDIVVSGGARARAPRAPESRSAPAPAAGSSR